MSLLLAASVFENPALVAVVAGLSGFAGTYLIYRASRIRDNEAKQVNIATVEAGMVNTVIDGLNKLVEQLRDVNDSLRAEAAVLVATRAESREEVTALQLEIAGLNNKVAELLRNVDDCKSLIEVLNDRLSKENP